MKIWFFQKALNLADKLWDKGRKDEARDILKDVIKELKSSVRFSLVDYTIIL